MASVQCFGKQNIVQLEFTSTLTIYTGNLEINMRVDDCKNIENIPKTTHHTKPCIMGIGAASALVVVVAAFLINSKI